MGGSGGVGSGCERRRFAISIFIPCALLLLPLVFYLQCSLTLFPQGVMDVANGGPGFADGGGSLLHSLSDEELLERAATTEDESKHVRRQSLRLRLVHPHQSKVALLFLTTGRLPFEPLWAKFVAGNDRWINLYVHSDPFSFDTFLDRSSPFWGRTIPSRPTRRGSPSLIAAARRLLANALLDDPANSYFVLLSDRCIPIHGFRRIHKRLLGSPRKSFLEVISDSPFLPSRYDARGTGSMLPEIGLSDFKVGSQWFAITRRHAHMFVRDRKFWPKFDAPCLDEFSCYPEEHYFPTLMAMLDPCGSHNVSITRVHWPSDVNDGHPTMYHASDVSRRFIQELQEDMGGRFMFARKFADDALEPLLALSDVILKH